MAFTKALYYPWIDIRNETWLKNALFYWDTIQTIVPESVTQPYNNRTSMEFHDNGCLIPLRVNSNMREINSLEDKVFEYLNSKEGASLFLNKTGDNDYHIYKEKLPSSFRKFAIYPEKLPFEIRHMFENLFKDEDDAFLVDERFANFYMTILSTKLAEIRNISLLTEVNSYNALANSITLDNNINVVEPEEIYYHRRNRIQDKYLNEGLMSELLLKRINLKPDTSVKKIIKFREKHQDELGRFRVKVGEISGCISVDSDWMTIRQQIDDLIINEIQPSINDLIKALESNMIKFSVGGILKASLFSIPSASILAIFCGIIYSPIALFAGAGASLTIQTMLYNREKQNIISKYPYSYLLSMTDKFI